MRWYQSGTVECVEHSGGPDCEPVSRRAGVEVHVPNERLAGVAVVRNIEREGAIRR